MYMRQAFIVSAYMMVQNRDVCQLITVIITISIVVIERRNITKRGGELGIQKFSSEKALLEVNKTEMNRVG